MKVNRIDHLSLAAAAFLFIMAISLSIHYSFACNEALCASVVSKCMLTQSCKCEMKNCTCCKDCFNCLDRLFVECCSCVEMCPKSNKSAVELNKKSHVEDLVEPMHELFAALTETCDNLHRWTSYTYPAHKGVSFFKEFKYSTGSATRDENGKIKEEEFPDVNCTVAYMSQCMSWEKCKGSCSSMGATSYRWFHDGCCECIGKHCVNYGINESRCIECPIDREEALKNLREEGVTSVDHECLKESSDMNAAITSEGYSETQYL